MPNAVCGHGIDHAKRVYDHAVHIAAIEGANILAVGAACYLTDAGLDLTSGRENHIERSLEVANKVLEDIPELEPVKDVIFEAILHHEAEHEVPANISMEAKVVRDSETLDRLGRSGIRMTLTYGVWMGRLLCHSSDPLCLKRTPHLNDFTMDYVRYLFSLNNQMLTQTAKEISRTKLAEMNGYCEAFKSLCNGKRIPEYQEAFNLLDC
jgi:HD superfamily phosphodiesterase